MPQEVAPTRSLAGSNSAAKIVLSLYVPRERVLCMLWTIFAILLILWLLGWGFHVAGSLIHLVLVVALVVMLLNLLTGRRVVD